MKREGKKYIDPIRKYDPQCEFSVDMWYLHGVLVVMSEIFYESSNTLSQVFMDAAYVGLFWKSVAAHREGSAQVHDTRAGSE